MQAIQTKFLGFNSTIGRTRIRATAAAGSYIYDWDDSLNQEDNHKAAALYFIKSFGWNESSDYVGFATGTLKDGTYVHVPIHSKIELNQEGK